LLSQQCPVAQLREQCSLGFRFFKAQIPASEFRQLVWIREASVPDFR